MNPIKETMDLLDLVKTIAECYREAMRDGHVNWMDVPKFRPVLSSLGKAVDGADKVESELKDLDMAELILIANKLREIATVLKAGK